MQLDPLPVDEVRAALAQALERHPCALLRAPTGAGKTTRIPPWLLDAGLAGSKQVVVLEPRRLAARAAAARIASERGAKLGGEVGYHVRFDRRASARTRLLVVTEGILVRMLQDDPFLERVGLVVFDEIHERSLQADLALSMVRKVQREARPDLRVVAMSATFVPDALARYLGDAPVIESEGRTFPVELEWLEREDDGRIAERVARGVGSMLERSPGDLLAFLPGVGEIKRTGALLAPLARARGLDLVELFGDLPPELQDRALFRGPRRRVVLATNVAQTSVTVEGVTAVVDSGQARISRFDPGVGLDRLELDWISRSAADQRSGRAGRTAPGVCLRLWTPARERTLSAEDEPEVRRVDLARAVLELAAWGERDPAAFEWFEPPPPAALAHARETLEQLGALDAGGLTGVGRELARMPLAPRLARLVHAGARLGVGARAALAAALLEDRDVVRRRERTASPSDSDVVDRVAALEAYEARGRVHSEAGELVPAAARRALRARDQLVRGLERVRVRPPADEDEALARALFAAFSDRLARRRAAGDARAVMVGGRGVRLSDESAVREPEWFVCVATDAGRRGERAEARVRMASGVRAEWIPAQRFESAVELRFDPERERVLATRVRRLEGITLEEVQVQLPEGPAVAACLAEAALAAPERALALDEERVAAWLARLRSLAGWRPELELPRFEQGELRAVLEDLTAGASSFAELRRRDRVEFLAGRLTWEQRAALEREAPERLEVPSGSRIALQYEPGRAPVLAVRIQEVFGLASTPRVAGGRVPVLLHLLGPNYRPQQVTDDLASFWANTYPEVRKELRRRYPKHAWPEDPTRADAIRGPRRRRQ